MKDQTEVISWLLDDDTLVKRTMVLNRGDVLMRAGEIANWLYLVRSGAIQALYVSAHETHTIRFGYSGSLIAAIPSFYDQQPSEITLQAIRKTEVIAISRKSFMQATERDSQMAAFYTKSLELLAAQQMEREIDLLTSSPVERVERVMARSPRLFQEIPAKYIAAYLRMTPETLSRLLKS